MNCNGSITEHSLWTGSCTDDLLIEASLSEDWKHVCVIRLPEPYRVCEGGKNAKFEFLLGVVAGYIQQSSSGKLLLVHFEVGEGSVASHTPADETVCPIKNPVFI